MKVLPLGYFERKHVVIFLRFSLFLSFWHGGSVSLKIGIIQITNDSKTSSYQTIAYLGSKGEKEGLIITIFWHN